MDDVPEMVAKMANAVDQAWGEWATARLTGFRPGLGLSEDTTRRIVVEVTVEGLETEEDRLAEIRRRMLRAAQGKE